MRQNQKLEGGAELTLVDQKKQVGLRTDLETGWLEAIHGTHLQEGVLGLKSKVCSDQIQLQ